MTTEGLIQEDGSISFKDPIPEGIWTLLSNCDEEGNILAISLSQGRMEVWSKEKAYNYWIDAVLKEHNIYENPEDPEYEGYDSASVFYGAGHSYGVFSKMNDYPDHDSWVLQKMSDYEKMHPKFPRVSFS